MFNCFTFADDYGDPANGGGLSGGAIGGIVIGVMIAIFVITVAVVYVLIRKEKIPRFWEKKTKPQSKCSGTLTVKVY